MRVAYILAMGCCAGLWTAAGAVVLDVPSEFYPTVQSAIDAASAGDEVVLAEGTHNGDIHLSGKNIVLRSQQPQSTSVVRGTVLEGTGEGPVITCAGSEEETCRIQGLTITGGHVREGPGGGIQGNGTKASIEWCILEGNRASMAGGAIHGCQGTISHCIIRNNWGQFGAIGGSHGLISNCLIVQNESDTAAGLNNCDGTILNCTIADNYGSAAGALKDCDGEVLNSIIWANSSPQFANCSAELSHCCYGGATGFNIGEAPAFVDRIEYRLRPGSPCVDAGASTEGLPGIDLGGSDRFLDGDQDGEAVVDIGAWERTSEMVGFLDVSTEEVTFLISRMGNDILQKPVTLRNTGTAAATWRIDEECSWVAVTPCQGEIPASGTVVLTVAVDPTELMDTTARCSLRILSDSENQTPPVRVCLKRAEPRLAATPDVVFDLTESEPVLNCSFEVMNGGGGLLEWEAAEVPEFLSLSRTEGTLRSEESQQVYVTLDTAGLPDEGMLFDVELTANNGGFRIVKVAIVREGTWVVPSVLCPTLQSAVSRAASGETILLRSGVYTGTGNRDFTISKSLTLAGISGAEHCVLDCNGTGVDPHIGLTIAATDVTVRGITVRRGHPRGAYETIGASGIRVRGEGARLQDCVFEEMRGGWAVELNEVWSAIVQDCVFRNNAQTALYVDDCSPTIASCQFFNNQTGVETSSDYSKISRCLFEGNGAGVDFGASYGTLSSSVLRRNGMGVACHHVSPDVKQCIIEDNGTGIYTYDSSAEIDSCLVAGNGCGIRSLGDHATILNCTIVDNGDEGGLLAFGDTEVRNCILYGNGGPDRGQVIVRYHPVSMSYCLIEGGKNGVVVQEDGQVEWGAGILDGEPGFAFEGDYHLRAGSRCIDTGGCCAVLDYDVDGRPRRLDGNGDGKYTMDLGAYEYDPEQPVLAVSKKDLRRVIRNAEDAASPIELDVKKSGGGQLDLSVETEEPGGWVRDIAVESTDEQTARVRVSLSDSPLVHGEYAFTLAISDSEAMPRPVRVPVRLSVPGTLRVPADFTTIQTALDAAVDGDKILVSDGIYSGRGNRDLMMPKKSITLASESGPERCRIDCQNLGAGFLFDSPNRCDYVVSGFEVVRGFSDDGGGLQGKFVRGLRVSDCIFRRCGGPHTNGYAIVLFWGEMLDCILRDNHCGGIWLEEGLVDRCQLEGHRSELAIWGNGILRDTSVCNNLSGGVTLMDSHVTRCNISGNLSFRRADWSRPPSVAGLTLEGVASVDNTVISGNYSEGGYGGMFAHGEVTITNCTIADNHSDSGMEGVLVAGPKICIANTVLWGNDPNATGGQIAARTTADQPTRVEIDHSLVQGGAAGVRCAGGAQLVWSAGNRSSDPLFVGRGSWMDSGIPGYRWDDTYVPGDYHLRSRGGRWDWMQGRWVKDDVMSPGVDAGSPGENQREELWPHGNRINMGAYGGTVEASLSQVIDGAGELTDLDGDGDLDVDDLLTLAQDWLISGRPIASDLDRDGQVTLADLQILSENW